MFKSSQRFLMKILYQHCLCRPKFVAEFAKTFASCFRIWIELLYTHCLRGCLVGRSAPCLSAQIVVGFDPCSHGPPERVLPCRRVFLSGKFQHEQNIFS